MPPIEGKDYGDEIDFETNSADSNLLEMTKVSEEERQAAIERVTFERCELVRAVGERYRDGDSIPVIAAESGKPMMTVRKAVKTYYLIFAEPPIGKVSTQEFRDGRRYFVDGDDVAALDAETQIEAEKNVRAFVGRTLLDNDPHAVDIKGPLPEMPAIGLDGRARIEEATVEGLTEIDDSLPEFQSPSLPPSFYSDLKEQTWKNVQGVRALMESGVMHDVQEATNELMRTTIPELERTIRPCYLGVTTGSALASTAAMSSVAAASIGQGVDPAVLQIWNQPGVREAVQAMQTLPVREMSRSLDQQLGWVSEVVKQMDALHRGLSGVGASMTGAAVTGPDATGFSTARPEDVIEQLEASQFQSESAQIRDPTEAIAWFDERFDIPSPKDHALFYIGIADLVLTLLQMEFPGHRGLMLASPVSKLVLGVYIYVRYYR